MAESYKTIQAENYQLRDYIINLQQRLLDKQVDVPPPPSNINLSSGHADASAQQLQSEHDSRRSAPTASMTQDAVSQLQAAAAQANNIGDAPKHGLPLEAEYPADKRQKSAEDIEGARGGGKEPRSPSPPLHLPSLTQPFHSLLLSTF